MTREELSRVFDPAKRRESFDQWKVELRYPPQQDRFADARRLVAAGFPCEGIAASWCPNCGDCICDREEGLDRPDCPLHAADSPHAEGRLVGDE